jgi:hypothetical protein
VAVSTIIDRDLAIASSATIMLVIKSIAGDVGCDASVTAGRAAEVPNTVDIMAAVWNHPTHPTTGAGDAGVASDAAMTRSAVESVTADDGSDVSVTAGRAGAVPNSADTMAAVWNHPIQPATGADDAEVASDAVRTGRCCEDVRVGS